MDGCTTVATTRTASATLPVEQAIFTAVRNARGAGYRIVAASPGLDADDQREIVQRAPSHESLCDAGPDACGLAAFPLRSGRLCLFLVQHAGREKTSRGGLRVYTRIFVLGPAAYTGLGADPLRLAALLPDAGEIPAQPPSRLSALQLDAGVAPRATAPPPPLRPGVLTLATAVLAPQSVLVTEAPDPVAILRGLWDCLPLARRQTCSVSYGLRFAPSRRFDVMLAHRPDARGLHFAAEQGCHVYPWHAASPATQSAYAPWLDFVARRWATGDARAVRSLADRAAAPLTAETLNAATQWHDAIDAAADAQDAAQLEPLRARLRAGRPSEPLLAALYDELAEAVAVREGTHVLRG